LRAPLDILFLVCCIALTADVLGPEIWGSGKTKDYPLWFWAGQQVLQGKNLYPNDLNAYFEFIYPPLSAVTLRSQLVRRIRLPLPVADRCRCG
jgi:hypothetical protein